MNPKGITIILSLISIFCSVAVFSYGQGVSGSKKEIYSDQAQKLFITEFITSGNDTSYEVKFDNAMRVIVVDFVNFSLNKIELKEMVDSLHELTKEKYQSGVRMYISDKVAVSKLYRYDKVRYYISAKAGFGELTRKQIIKLNQKVHSYFNY